MATQLMTYAELATAWGVSREAARKKVEGLRLPKQTGNDGKARIMIDLGEVEHRPLKRKHDRRPPGDHPRRADGDRPESPPRGQVEIEALKAHVTTLLAEVERLTSLAATHRTDFERERERAEKAVADLTHLIDKLSAAERDRTEKAGEAERAIAEAERARADLTMWKSWPWWKRLIG